MADFCGKPLICHTLEVVQGLFQRQVVVTRSSEVAELCRQKELKVILHDLPYRSDALRLGLNEMNGMDGCMFCLGDQPLLGRKSVLSLIQHWESDRDSIWRTQFQSTPGSPVLFPAWAFPKLSDFPGGQGGSWVIKAYPDRVKTISVQHEYELMDVDTREDLCLLQRLYQGLSEEV